jgi:flotillin
MVIGEGGCIFVLPCCQTYDLLDLTIRTIDLQSNDVLSKKGVKVSLNGVAQVRIHKREDMLKEAAAQFLGMGKDQITDVVTQTMEGHQRAIIGSMTMEALYSDRHEFANQVREVCKEDMLKMGMEVVSYVITDITDKNEYFDSLGVARVQEVKKNAAVGKEKYQSEVKINQAMCNSQVEIEKVQREQEANTKQQAAFTKIAEHKKNYKVQDTEFKRQIELAQQSATRDIKIQQASFAKEINEEEVKAAAAEQIERKKQEASVQEQEKRVVAAVQEVSLEQKKGETLVAEQAVKAEGFKQEAEITVIATAKAEAKQVSAKADAQVKTVTATADATKVRTEAGATAESTREVGMAQAEVIKAKGVCEAEAMTAKAAAWKEYTQGAYIDMIVQQLPEIANQIAQPLAKTEKIVMISNGADGSGAGKLTREITQMVAELPAVAENLTGIDITKAIKDMAHKRGAA